MKLVPSFGSRFRHYLWKINSSHEMMMVIFTTQIQSMFFKHLLYARHCLSFGDIVNKRHKESTSGEFTFLREVGQTIHKEINKKIRGWWYKSKLENVTEGLNWEMYGQEAPL